MPAEKKWTQYMYYIIIGVISFVALVFLPMFGSEVGMAFTFPTTPAGWVVYIITQAIMSVVNVLIFHSFICQAKINIKDDTNYLRAVEILRAYTSKTYTPRSYAQFRNQEYRWKGISIAIGTLLGGFALTQAILSYDYVRMLSYLFTVIFGIIFGILEMKKWEEYYTTEYLDYAYFYEKQQEEEARKAEEEARRKAEEEALREAERSLEEVQTDLFDEGDASGVPNRGVPILVAPDYNGVISPVL
jgi:uncharacterized membrane protein